MYVGLLLPGCLAAAQPISVTAQIRNVERGGEEGVRVVLA